MPKIFASIALFLMVSVLSSNPVLLNDASSFGEKLFSSISGVGNSEYATEPHYSSENKDYVDFYIMRFQPKGFLIIAGDDRSSPVLAYSLDTFFPEGKMPDHVQWYLDQYSLSMKEIREHKNWRIDPDWSLDNTGDYLNHKSNRSVSPLLTTTWDQGWPYNYACPADPNGPGGRVYAGCVATAMAQIMKKWNHPIFGYGAHSYNTANYGTLSANFSTTTYGWANMPNSISSVNTSIATLIYHCGIAVDMEYTPYSSGAFSINARNALVNYFLFNNLALYANAASYATDTWKGMLRNDLDLGRPVFYRGSGDSGGHAFVLDGYQGTDYFHVNWGWSGYCDGYFYLDNLNPGSNTFTQDQAAIMNLYPAYQTANDLSALSLSGSAAIIVNEPTLYTATIRNLGTNSQTDYTVRLVRDNGVILASIPGLPVAPGFDQSFVFSWTPDNVGYFVIYAEVVLSTDSYPLNNESQHRAIVVGNNSNYPHNVSIMHTGSMINLTWDAVDNAGSYNIFSSSSPESGYLLDNTGTFNGSSWTSDIIGDNRFYYVTANIVPEPPMPSTFVEVQGGTFNNGTSNVSISTFYIEKYEVTQASYLAVTGNNPSIFTGDLNRPVDSADWFNAIEYCNRRSIQEGLIPCYSFLTYGTNPANWPWWWRSLGYDSYVICNWNAHGYRLPTEMEWMFAAKGGIMSQNYVYSGGNNINSLAWYSSNSNNTSHLVGTKAPNELGLYDMSGNLWEWCWDLYGDYPQGSQSDPTGASSGIGRINRGGAWFNSSEYFPLTYRAYHPANYSTNGKGFRVVRRTT